jgi:hypothetical protein
MADTNDNRSAGIDWLEAAYAANLCRQIYAPTAAGPFCLYIGHQSTLAGLVRQEKALYVVFQGTNEAADWMVNLQFWKERAPYFGGGRVHRGFAAVARAFVNDIRQLYQPGQRLVLAGHSLGGALATLVAYALADLQPVVYTYGQPRVGDRRLSADIDHKIRRYYRFVHTNDIVPCLPLLGYRHAGQQYYIDRKGVPSAVAHLHLRLFWDRALALLQFYLQEGWGLHSVAAHDITHYALALTRHAIPYCPRLA